MRIEIAHYADSVEVRLASKIIRGYGGERKREGKIEVKHCIHNSHLFFIVQSSCPNTARVHSRSGIIRRVRVIIHFQWFWGHIGTQEPAIGEEISINGYHNRFVLLKNSLHPYSPSTTLLLQHLPHAPLGFSVLTSLKRIDKILSPFFSPFGF